MHICRKIGKELEIYAGGDIIRMTIWSPIIGGRCESVRISLTPAQAIKVANSLMCPPGTQPIELMNGTSELRQMWQVYKVKHGNGATRGMIGISNNTGTILGLNDDFMSLGRGEDKTRLTDHFYCTEVNLTSKEVITVSGLLFLWAGSKFVGTRQICKTTKEYILNTEDEKK